MDVDIKLELVDGKAVETFTAKGKVWTRTSTNSKYELFFLAIITYVELIITTRSHILTIFLFVTTCVTF